MQVTVTGGTGLIGRRLVQRLQERGDALTLLATRPMRAQQDWGLAARHWHAGEGLPPLQALEGCDALVHLAGAPVFRRWTARTRRQIQQSRIEGTRQLVEALGLLTRRPGVLVSASAVGYYGAHGAEEVDERTPPGQDFLAQVCQSWEQAALAAQALGVRVVTLRIGIVLAADGGALGALVPLCKAGLGGPIGSGAQYVPWITREDVVGLILAALDQEAWAGPINATAPEPVTQRAFAHALGQVLHRPALLPVPAWALRVALGPVASTVTTGQRAIPRRAQALGYHFAQQQIGDGLTAALVG